MFGKKYNDQPFMQGGSAPLLTLESRKQVIDIFSLPATIGRNGEEVDVYLFDESISRTHCKFDYYQGGITVTDLYSTTGTRLEKTNLIPGQPYMIESGLKIRIGKVKFKITVNHQAMFNYNNNFNNVGNYEEESAAPQVNKFAFDESTQLGDETQFGGLEAVQMPSYRTDKPHLTEEDEEYDYDAEITEPLVKAEDSGSTGEETEIITFSAIQEEMKFPVKSLVDKETGQVVCTIDKSPFIIGRKSDGTDAVIDISGISRRHMIIEKMGEEFYVTDMNSTNGVEVNGELIEADTPTVIKPGDIIGLGEKEYRFDD